MTSHAAVVARGMGKPCVAGCEGLEIDIDARTLRIGGHDLREGDTITIDGGTGRVILGAWAKNHLTLTEAHRGDDVQGWPADIDRLSAGARGRGLFNKGDIVAGLE